MELRCGAFSAASLEASADRYFFDAAGDFFVEAGLADFFAGADFPAGDEAFAAFLELLEVATLAREAPEADFEEARWGVLGDAAPAAGMATLAWSPTFGFVPMMAAENMSTVDTSRFGLSQISASEGRNMTTRISGSSGESHQALFEELHRSWIRARSFDMEASPDMVTNLKPLVSA